ncbi:hypothetical protein JCM10213v2_007828 [Rhodosporidiobolus nylandii]
MSTSKVVSQLPAPADFFAQPSGKQGLSIDFEKKVVVVTGGNRGLGRGIVEALAQANASVAMIYNSAKDADEVAAELRKKWSLPIRAYQCNVSDAARVKEVFGTIEKEMGEITGVVANSGISVVKPALELGKEDFDKVFGVNVFGVFNTCQAAAALWTERKHAGSIVVISSMSDTIVNSPIQQAFYNASKGGVSNLSRCLAAEWAPYGIRVNNVNPGFIETDQLRENQCKEVPLGRFSKTYEQAGQVVYLLSKYSSYQTGSSVYIDGGYLMW